MAFICVEGYKLSVTPMISGSASIETSPSAYVKINGKKCYRGNITVKVSDYQGGAIVPNPATSTVVSTLGVGSGTISGSSRATKIDGSAAVLEGDSTSVTVNGALYTPGSSQPTPVSQVVTVKIISAGQSDIKSD